MKCPDCELEVEKLNKHNRCKKCQIRFNNLKYKNREYIPLASIKGTKEYNISMR